jgi:putative transposase
MPRRARAYLADMPYHIVQRGNNREMCFFQPEDYQSYLLLWREISARYGVAVHAYCLMTNHIHFLVTPSTEDGISRTMSVVGSRYAFLINSKLKRTGTLWEGRHKGSLVDSSNYLLACYRYIEQNPVRAKMVSHPGDYEWSSNRINSSGADSWLTPHDEYLALGKTLERRVENYQDLLSSNLSDQSLTLIRSSSHYCHVVGDEAFRKRVHDDYGVALGYAARGRPQKKDA